jgi:NADH-quinone oxidoreductase subunit I
MIKSVKEILGGFWSLLVGMKVTFDQFRKPLVNTPYPHKVLEIPKRYRGHIVFIDDPELEKSRCIACKMCEKVCPSECIAVDGEKKEGEKKKSATNFDLDFTKCSLCGLCIEVCPTNALEHSKRFNLASTRKDYYGHIDLIADLDARKQDQKQPKAS